MRDGIFRKEALQYHSGQRLWGDVLRFDLRWLTGAPLLALGALGAVTAAVLYFTLFEVNDYLSALEVLRGHL